MNAREARQLTETYLHPDIETLVTAIDARIEEAAKHGQTHLTNPEAGHPPDSMPLTLTQAQRAALRKHYESRGFHWQETPRTGHPCCRGITTISW